jgi:hypothetical protein
VDITVCLLGDSKYEVRTGDFPRFRLVQDSHMLASAQPGRVRHLRRGQGRHPGDR